MYVCKITSQSVSQLAAATTKGDSIIIFPCRQASAEPKTAQRLRGRFCTTTRSDVTTKGHPRQYIDMEGNPAERIIQWVPKPPAKINREPQVLFSAHHNTSQRINPKAGPRPASSPMSTVLMGGSGLTGTLATLLGDPPPSPLCGKLKVISPPVAPCPTTSFDTHSPLLFSSCRPEPESSHLIHHLYWPPITSIRPS